jgi:hypothetical protein
MFFWDIVIHLTKGVFEVEGEENSNAFFQR